MRNSLKLCLCFGEAGTGHHVAPPPGRRCFAMGRHCLQRNSLISATRPWLCCAGKPETCTAAVRARLKVHSGDRTFFYHRRPTKGLCADVRQFLHSPGGGRGAGVDVKPSARAPCLFCIWTAPQGHPRVSTIKH